MATKKKKTKAAAPQSSKGSVTRHLEAQKGTVFTEAELTAGLNDDLRDAWKKLRTFAVSLGRQRIYASALSIMFAKKTCYFYVRPRKTSLEVWIFLPRALEGLPSTKGPTKKPRYSNLFKVTHADQVEEPLTDWLREAFDFSDEMQPAQAARDASWSK